MKCYLGDPSATNKAVTSDGWFMTGDLAVQDDDGFVYIRDRGVWWHVLSQKESDRTFFLLST